MAANISYFIVFGIIAIVNGKAAADDVEAYVTGESGLQKILQLLENQGKYDIALSHHEDGPNNHHEDTAHIYSVGKHRNKYNKQKTQYATRYDSDEAADYDRNDNNLQDVLNNVISNADKSQHKSNANDVLGRLLSLDSNNFKLYKAREDEENNEDIVAFLNDLQKNIADDGSYVSELRCTGNRCERDSNNRNDDDNRDRDNLESLLDSNLLGNKIKLSDDLDAVVLGMSDVERLLSRTNSPKLDQTKGPALLDNVNLENILNGQDNLKRSNVEALVFDLTRVDNGDAIATQIKDLLSDNNEQDASIGDYVSGIEKQISNGGKETKGNYNIVAHHENNNNMYVPQWLLDLVSHPETKQPDLVQLLQYYSPPKSKKQLGRQEARLKTEAEARKRKQQKFNSRRNFDHDVGVPFHLEVQGLGQVNPNAP